MASAPVVRELDAAISALGLLDLAGLGSAGCLELARELLGVFDRLDAQLQRVIGHADATAASWECASLGMISWLRRECRRAPAESKARIAAAERAVLVPDTAAAHEAGQVSLAHLRVIGRVVEDLPEPARPRAEAVLLDAARRVDPLEVDRLGRQLRAQIDPDASTDAAERRLASRRLTVAATFGGMVHLDGLLDQAAGEAVLAALAPLTAPAGADDPRSAAQRRADALGQLARIAFGGGQLPQQAGAPPTVLVTVSLDALREQTWDALREQTWDALRERTGTGWAAGTGWAPGTGSLDAATVRRLACDAKIIPVVLDGDGQPLDVGRSTKTWPVAIRRAAALRDRGCTFPGCGAPLYLTELHHLQFWADGGPTSLTNSTHLCSRHHTTVHHGTWSVHRDNHGTLTWTDPTGHHHHWHPPPQPPTSPHRHPPHRHHRHGPARRVTGGTEGDRRDGDRGAEVTGGTEGDRRDGGPGGTGGLWVGGAAARQQATQALHGPHAAVTCRGEPRYSGPIYHVDFRKVDFMNGAGRRQHPPS